MAAATDEPERSGPTVDVVEFTLSGERFAVAVEDVDSIEDLEGATRVPRTGEAIDGVMDLRGEITAIIDPRVHLDVEGGDAAEQVLVLDDSKDKQKLGLGVDQVQGVEEYPESTVADADELPELDTAGVDRRAIGGVIRGPSEDSDFEPIALIDVDEVVRLSRQGR